MATPQNYTRKHLQRILTSDSYELFHWTNLFCAKNIIATKKIYSIATLFGLNSLNLNFLSSVIRKRQDLIVSAEHGLIDYIFLGNTNWIEKKLPSKYGEVGFVIKPEEILLKKDFLVFPFNVGYHIKTSHPNHKISDLTILMEALQQSSPKYEILVRRKIVISEKIVKKIICRKELESELLDLLKEKKLNIKVEPIYVNDECRDNNMPYLIITNPFDNKSQITIDKNNYVIDKNLIYITIEHSNCVLVAEIKNDLIFDPNTSEEIGKLIKSNILTSEINKI